MRTYRRRLLRSGRVRRITLPRLLLERWRIDELSDPIVQIEELGFRRAMIELVDGKEVESGEKGSP